MAAQSDLRVWSERRTAVARMCAPECLSTASDPGSSLSNPEASALSERSVEIQDFAIYFDRDRVAQQPGPNGCDNVARQSAFGSFTGGAVGEPQRQHFLV